jgi:hypothetical protein
MVPRSSKRAMLYEPTELPAVYPLMTVLCAHPREHPPLVPRIAPDFRERG